MVRVDASAQMGTGHVMRCLALAQGWQDLGGSVVFATIDLPDSLAQRLAHNQITTLYLQALPGSTEDVQQLIEQVKTHGCTWIVVDGYHFGADYQARLCEAGCKVLFVDDYGHAERYTAQLILNQNLGAKGELYQSRSPASRLLLGPKYALLRREFWAWRGLHRTIPAKAKNVLITLGGSDPDNVTQKALEAVVGLHDPALQCTAIVGSSFSQLATLKNWAKQHPHVDIRSNVTDMPEWMKWADVAIAAGGTTTWERCLLGLPSIVVVLADNQVSIAKALEDRQLATVVQSSTASIQSALHELINNFDKRQQMARGGQALVDGWGVQRVLAQMHPLPLELQPATQEHARLLYAWANQPEIRQASFNNAPIPWEVHQQWYTDRLHDPLTQMWLICTPDTPIGLVRFQMEQDEATISINLCKEYQGLGLGHRVIQLACERFLDTYPSVRIQALIRKENRASVHAFQKAGFQNLQPTMVKGCEAYRLTLQRVSS